MSILFYCIGAAVLVLTGAVVSGGLRLPVRTPKPAPAHDAQAAEDALSRDLAALMAYGREEDDHAV